MTILTDEEYNEAEIKFSGDVKKIKNFVLRKYRSHFKKLYTKNEAERVTQNVVGTLYKNLN